MPVYNGEKYLRLAIESILKQTYEDFEFLIINDGSRDRSEEIILSYNDSRIVYVKNEQNLGLIRTLNKGIDLAKGEYIARMDCDDISLSDRLEIQIKYFQEDSTLDFLASLPIHLLSNGRTFRSYRFYSLHDEAIRFESIIEISFCHPCIMCKSSILRKYKYQESVNYTHIEDYELGLRLSQKGVKMYYSNDFVLYYRKNKNGVSLSNRQIQTERVYNLSKRVLKYIYSYELNKENYLFIVGKKGWYTSRQLKDTCSELDGIFNAFIRKERISELGLKEIETYIHYQKFAYWLTALAARNKSSFYALSQLLCHLSYLFEPFVKRNLYVFIRDKFQKKIHKEFL